MSLGSNEIRVTVEIGREVTTRMSKQVVQFDRNEQIAVAVVRAVIDSIEWDNAAVRDIEIYEIVAEVVWEFGRHMTNKSFDRLLDDIKVRQG
jgi:hypothetical protein